MPSDQQLVICALAGQEYCLPIQETREIMRLTDITRLPGIPMHMEGVINLRGTILPIINLARLLGLPVDEDTGKERIVVVGQGDKRAGLIVGGVNEIGLYSEGELKPPVIGERGEGFISAVVNKGERLWLFLNLAKILDYS